MLNQWFPQLVPLITGGVAKVLAYLKFNKNTNSQYLALVMEDI